MSQKKLKVIMYSDYICPFCYIGFYRIEKFKEQYEFDVALKKIWDEIKICDGIINDNKVWELKGTEKQKILTDLVNRIRRIGYDLQPFLPRTAEKILAQFSGNQVKPQPPLFPRIK